MRKKRYAALTAGILLASIIIVPSCNTDVPESVQQETEKEESTETSELTYTIVSAEQAKQMMETEEDYVILDVRTDEEYNESHIPKAVLIPDYEVEQRAEAELPDKDQLILVYCRSGRRSKLAAQTLVDLGYKNVYEFGGIIDWPYEVE